MRKRPRISIEKHVEKDEFSQNCASHNAKFVYKYKDFEIEIWIDKHYQDRVDYGDDIGKRHGIDENIVIKLIVESFKYIFHFYSRHRTINFINFFEKGKVTDYRIVLKKYIDEQPLNVAIEIHFLDYSKYEVTIKTAMVIDDFRLSDGQYSISVTNDKVLLNRFVNKEIYRIDQINI